MQETNQKSLSNRFKRAKIPLRYVVAVAIAAGLLYGTYSIGESRGRKAEKARTTNVSTKSASVPDNHWALSGTVQNVTDKSFEIKDSKGSIKLVEIKKSTVITNLKNDKVDKSALQNNLKIIATGVKDTQDNYTAQRIRVSK